MFWEEQIDHDHIKILKASQLRLAHRGEALVLSDHVLPSGEREAFQGLSWLFVGRKTAPSFLTFMRDARGGLSPITSGIETPPPIPLSFLFPVPPSTHMTENTIFPRTACEGDKMRNGSLSRTEKTTLYHCLTGGCTLQSKNFQKIYFPNMKRTNLQPIPHCQTRPKLLCKEKTTCFCFVFESSPTKIWQKLLIVLVNLQKYRPLIDGLFKC